MSSHELLHVEDREAPESEDSSVRERSIGVLVSDLMTNTEKLVQQELALAIAELDVRVNKTKREAVKAATVVGLLAGGGLSGLGALIMLLAEVMEPWLAALIVSFAMSGSGWLALKAAQQKARSKTMELAEKATGMK